MELGAGAGADSNSHTSTPLDLTLSYHLLLLLPPLLPSLGSLPPHPAHSLCSPHALRCCRDYRCAAASYRCHRICESSLSHVNGACAVLDCVRSALGRSLRSRFFEPVYKPHILWCGSERAARRFRGIGRLIEALGRDFVATALSWCSAGAVPGCSEGGFRSRTRVCGARCMVSCSEHGI